MQLISVIQVQFYQLNYLTPVYNTIFGPTNKDGRILALVVNSVDVIETECADGVS